MGSRFILDTNFLIPVEDPRRTPELYAALLRDLAARGHQAFVHEASLEDLGRDKDPVRRAISLSKAAKYPLIEKSWRNPGHLETEFGPIRKANDLCDCHILSAAKDRVVDFIITEDVSLHTRAREAGLGDKVLYVRQALDLINERYAGGDYSLRSIERRKAHQLNPADPIFDSLREAYPGFDEWLEACRAKQRDCWVVRDESSLAGVVILKEEVGAEVPRAVSGNRVLKLCTFKVSEGYRGGRLGEQLLRQAMCHAYDAVYLTTFPRQQSLRELIEHYGFVAVEEAAGGELLYAKGWDREIRPDAHDYEATRKQYPAFPCRFPDVYVVPVRPIFHDRLFPEAANKILGTSGLLFDGVWSQGDPESSSPSNSIRKAYLCHSPTRQVAPGSLLCFYRSQDALHGGTGALTAVGLAEDYTTFQHLGDAIAAVAKRSVYRTSELEAMIQRKGCVKVLRFLFYGYLEPAITIRELRTKKLMTTAPQSIMRVRGESASHLVTEVERRVVAG